MVYLKHLVILILLLATNYISAQEINLSKLAIASAEHSKQAAFFLTQNLTEENTSADLLKNYNEALIACEKAIVFSDSAINNINDSSFSEKVAKLALKNAKNNQEKAMAILDELTALSETEIDLYSPKEATLLINNAVLDAYKASLELGDGKIVVAKTSTIKNDKPTEIEPEKAPDLIYRVQMGLFRQKIDANYFGLENELKFEQVKEGVWRYYMGDFYSYKAAKGIEQMVKGKEYDAFIIAFYKGKKIAVSEAIKLEK